MTHTTLKEAYNQGIVPLTNNQITTEQAFDRVAVPMKKFMLAHVRQADVKLFLDMSNTKPPKNALDTPITTVAPAASC